MSETVTINEAARILGKARDTVRRLIREGALTAEPNPIDKREMRIPRQQVEALAEKYGRG